MKHIEVHVVYSPGDLELAQVGGILEDSDTPMIVTCSLCEEMILLPTEPRSDTPQAHVLVSDTGQAISCESCLGLALQTMMLYT